MNAKILTAPIYDDINGPLVFLAGPIQGAPDWQSEAIKLFESHAPELNIANPRRFGKYKKEKNGDFTVDMYNEQVDWETHHLRRAGSYGVILFWLAREHEHLCGRAYAQTSRFELAEWKMMHQEYGPRVVVGIEPGFSGGKYVRRRLSQDCPHIPLCGTLEETVGHAIRLAHEQI